MSDYNRLSDFRDIRCRRHLKERCRTTVRFANRISDNCILLKAQIHSCTACPYFLTDLGKIRNKIPAISTRDLQFRVIGCSENHTQFYSVNKNMSVFYIFFITTGNNSTRHVHTDVYRVTAGNVKFGEVTTITYLEAYFSLYPYFPHLLPDMVKILYNKSAHAVMEFL
jgi:hypothetical protein